MSNIAPDCTMPDSDRSMHVTEVGRWGAAVIRDAPLRRRSFLAGWLNHVFTRNCHFFLKCWLGMTLLCFTIAAGHRLRSGAWCGVGAEKVHGACYKQGRCCAPRRHARAGKRADLLLPGTGRLRVGHMPKRTKPWSCTYGRSAMHATRGKDPA